MLDSPGGTGPELGAGFGKKLDDLQIFLKPGEMMQRLCTKDGIPRFCMIFAGLVVLSWLAPVPTKNNFG